MYCDAHVEFIHPKVDLVGFDQSFLYHQVNEDLINEVRPELVFLAVYILPEGRKWQKMLWTIKQYLKIIDRNKWVLVKSGKDLDLRGIKVILHIEDLESIGSDLSRIDRLHSLGIRSIGMTHNHQNQFAGGSLATEEGITPLGKLAISKILANKMILDFAHLSKKSFLEVCSTFNIKPFISHTGLLYGRYTNPRNVDDQILQIVKQKEGFVGIGFAGSFYGKNDASLDNVYDQIQHAENIASKKHVGIGSDFGGIVSYLIDGLESIAKIDQLNISHEMLGSNLLHFLNTLDF